MNLVRTLGLDAPLGSRAAFLSTPRPAADAAPLPGPASDGFTRQASDAPLARGPRFSGAVAEAAPTGAPTADRGVAPAVAGSLAGGVPGAVATQALPSGDLQPVSPKVASAVAAQASGVAGAAEHLGALSPSERDGFMRVAEKLFDPGLTFFRKAGTSPELMALLASGRLHDTDTRGATLLDNLVTMATQPLAKGFDSAWLRGQMIGQLVTQTANPDRIEQGAQGTCTATTIQWGLATHAPAEYARLVSGLLQPEGVVAMRSGAMLERPAGIHMNDSSGRAEVSRVFQAAVMDYANGPLVHYDNYTDLNRPLQASEEARNGVHKGLFQWEVKGALEALTPHRYECPTFRDVPAERAEMRARVSSASPDQTLPVILRWSTPKPNEFGLHMLALEKIDDKYAWLRNPQGTVEEGLQGDPALDLPSREAVGAAGSGHIRMPIDTFFDRLQIYFAPK